MEITKKRRLSQEDGISSLKKQTVMTDSPDALGESTKNQRRTLFVRSLPASITTDQLAEYFSQSYPIKHATVVQDSKTKTSKGYGFVTFADHEDAHQALTEFNGSSIDGRKIKIEIAEPRHRELAGEGGKSVSIAKPFEHKSDTLPPKLIIRNLPWSIKEPEDLANLFRSYGKVKTAVIPRKGPRAQSGFGFVVIRGRKNAEKALQGVNGKEVDGRTLAVDWAVDKKTWEELQKNETSEEAHNADAENGETVPATVYDDSSEDETGQALQDVEGSLSSENQLDEVSEDDDHMEVDSDDLDEDLDEEVSEDENDRGKDNASTIFLRNLPFTATDESLHEHFTPFGPVRYARVVMDPDTERSRGTGFVCFYNQEDARLCVKNAPKASTSEEKPNKKDVKSQSILQNEASDPSGKYTMEGRVLQVTRALSKEAATRKEAEGTDRRSARDHDKRRLYLLSEGTIPAGSALYGKLGPTEINMRSASAKQRQNLIKNNPSLHLSLTRLSVRNIPRSITSKDLKQLAREAVVGFATDAKNGLRQPLSKEESVRGGDDMKKAEQQRKLHGKGIVKQAKIVFEGREGGKVSEKSGGGRSRGYGFIEYATHRNALMGLRWLNGHMVKSSSGSADAGKEEKQKRLIVEFAIENAQVVARRKELEEKARNGELKPGRFAAPKRTDSAAEGRRTPRSADQNLGRKRKRAASESSAGPLTVKKSATKAGSNKGPEQSAGDPDEKNKTAKRNRIIAKKRHMRKQRRVGK